MVFQGPYFLADDASLRRFSKNAMRAFMYALHWSLVISSMDSTVDVRRSDTRTQLPSTLVKSAGIALCYRRSTCLPARTRETVNFFA